MNIERGSIAPPGSFTDGTETFLNVAAALNSATSIPCSYVLVQADPDNTIDILIGNATTQSIQLVPGQSVGIWIDDVNKVYRTAASATSSRANWWVFP